MIDYIERLEGRHMERLEQQAPELPNILNRSVLIAKRLRFGELEVSESSFGKFLHSTVLGGTWHENISEASDCIIKQRCPDSIHTPEERIEKSRYIFDVSGSQPLVPREEGRQRSFNYSFTPKRKPGIDGYGDLEILLASGGGYEQDARFVRLKQTADQTLTDLIIDYPGKTASIEMYTKQSLEGKRRPVEVASLSRDTERFREVLRETVMPSLVSIESATGNTQLEIPYWTA